MNFFTGEYNHQLDAKNRIRIPFKLKRDLGENYYFTKGTDGCLFILPEEVAKEQLEKIAEIKMSDVEKRRGARSFAKSFVAAEEDNQGRVVLPANLREFAGITKDVVFCGVGKRIELWSKENYDEYFNGDDEEYDAFFNSLEI
ncbi:MAG: division/cell wall cluster transcriptional repressor MraZ [Clostridia bacterium]|nr:division/cell wall cluster transcriptional repressor MraZ [Clostridia bacterium]MCD8308505.1 division/cell wall cluster transcriptional repressor MraZ [Clostridia bacterium]